MWVTAFLNKYPDLGGYLCDLGLVHQYDDENQRCQYCNKKLDGWDFFWG